MHEFESYEEIWEREAKWLAGRQLIQQAVDGIRAKGLVAYIDPNQSSTLQVRLPLPHTLVGDREIITLSLQTPKELQLILEDRLRLILASPYVTWITNVISTKHVGTRLGRFTIDQVNSEFQRFEDLSRSAGSVTIEGLCSHYFGLWPLPTEFRLPPQYTEVLGFTEHLG